MAKRRERPRTAVRAIVDESGSMGHVQHDTVEGYRAFLSTLSETPADVRVSLSIFDNQVRHAYENAFLTQAHGLDDAGVAYDAVTGGGTSLYDAVGDGIDRQALASAEDDRVIVVVITDGYDTDSTHHTAATIKAKVAEKRATGKWEFVWLGPNQRGAADVGMRPEDTFVLTDHAGLKGVMAQVAQRTGALLLLSAGTPESAASGT